MKRLISAGVGILLIGVVIYLGIQSGVNNIYIAPFGIVSALVAPLGLSALGYSIKKEDETLKKLAMIPKIDELIEQAETETEKIERLKREKEVLLSYIENETKRIAKIERKKILETDAKRILEEYEQIIDELNIMSNNIPDMQNVSEEIQQLYNIHNQMEITGQFDATKGVVVSILGIKYRVAGIFDIYRLPAEILVDQINRMTINLLESIYEIISSFANTFIRRK